MYIHTYSHIHHRSTENDLQSRITQAALNKQKQVNKRFKPQEPNEVKSTDASSEYLKIVEELQRAQGHQDTDNSKWHVR